METKMKISIISLIICITFNSLTNAQKLKFDRYIGYEPIDFYDSINKKMVYFSENPSEKWFYKNTLRIINDSIEIDKSPIAIRKNDTLYSASDGGFYYYKGMIISRGKIVNVKLRLDHCDYCPIPAKINPRTNEFDVDSSFYDYKIYKMTISKDLINLNNIQYRKEK